MKVTEGSEKKRVELREDLESYVPDNVSADNFFGP